MKAGVNNRKLRITGVFILIGIGFGFMYPLLGREILDPIALLNGITIGLLGSLFLSFSELYLNTPLKKKMKFIPQVLFKTLFYASFFILLILLVYSVNRSIFSHTNYLNYIKGAEFSAFIYEGDFNIIVGYTLVISAAIVFVHQMSLKMGQGILLNLIFGKYHHPTKEERIFMFLDLNDSTTLAEKMGEVRFNQFINEFFIDITDPIVQSYGLIYRYVGDEIVVTWKPSQGIRNINCLRFFFLVIETIKSLREKYLTKYSIIPQFSAAFHIGTVVIGQVGDIKSQIVLSGPALYEGNIIEKKCRDLGCSHLISHQLIEKLELPKFFKEIQVGEVNTTSSGLIRLFTVKTIDKL
ncbi:MAG: hypothetical protein ACFHWX_09870 [Bacteroidota bacterium]